MSTENDLQSGCVRDLTRGDIERYSRQMLLPEIGAKGIQMTRVFVKYFIHKASGNFILRSKTTEKWLCSYCWNGWARVSSRHVLGIIWNRYITMNQNFSIH